MSNLYPTLIMGSDTNIVYLESLCCELNSLNSNKPIKRVDEIENFLIGNYMHLLVGEDSIKFNDYVFNKTSHGKTPLDIGYIKYRDIKLFIEGKNIDIGIFYSELFSHNIVIGIFEENNLYPVYVSFAIRR